uniref:Uncharacterized protein n=1 Tax=Leersia perrieri TaxID=77586 RepID=A0A0D9WZX5_9ORYZ
MGHAAAFLYTPQNPVRAGRVVGGGSDRGRERGASGVRRWFLPRNRPEFPSCLTGLLSSSSAPRTAPAPSASLTRNVPVQELRLYFHKDYQVTQKT